MKNIQSPKLENIIHHAIGLVDNIIGLITLGSYCPYWEFDFVRYIVKKRFKASQLRSAK